MDKTTKNIVNIVGELGKNINTVEAELIWQWYDKAEKGWRTYNVERKQGSDVQTLFDKIFNDLSQSESKKDLKIESAYNSEKKKIGYIFLLPDKKFADESEPHKERVIVIFYRPKYDYIEVA